MISRSYRCSWRAAGNASTNQLKTILLSSMLKVVLITKLIPITVTVMCSDCGTRLLVGSDTISVLLNRSRPLWDISINSDVLYSWGDPSAYRHTRQMSISHLQLRPPTHVNRLPANVPNLHRRIEFWNLKCYQHVLKVNSIYEFENEKICSVYRQTYAKYQSLALCLQIYPRVHKSTPAGYI